METPFDKINDPIGLRVAAGLSRLALALKTNAQQGAAPHGLSPTQSQILALLRNQAEGMRPSLLAQSLAIKAPAMTEALQPLLARGLAVQSPDPQDGRAKRIAITDAGFALLATIADWPDALLQTVAELPPQEQAIFYRVILKMIRQMQVSGMITPGRLCITCTHFRPNAHADAETPHHCALVNAPFGDRHLRLDCPEQQHAAPDTAEAAWLTFLNAPPPSLPI